jgi:hypothetical protein
VSSAEFTDLDTEDETLKDATRLLTIALPAGFTRFLSGPSQEERAEWCCPMSKRQ